MQPTDFPNGLICLVAIVFAAFSKPSERRAAIWCASILLGVWLVGMSTYQANGITSLVPASYVEYGLSWDGELHRLPGGVSVDIWAVSDCLSLFAILLIAQDKWWGFVLSAFLLVGCICHALYWLRLADWVGYKTALNFTFLAEESVFYVIGGGGIWHAGVGVLRRIGHRSSHSPKSASAKETVSRG